MSTLPTSRKEQIKAVLFDFHGHLPGLSLQHSARSPHLRFLSSGFVASVPDLLLLTKSNYDIEEGGDDKDVDDFDY